MAIDVIINNKKSMFGKKQQLTQNNVMSNFSDNIQLGSSMSLHSRWNPLKKETNNIVEQSLILLDQKSYGRGIEVYVAEDMSYIKCSLLVPTVKCEIQLFETVVKTLAKFMNSKWVKVEDVKVSIKGNVLSDNLVDFALHRSFNTLRHDYDLTLPCSFYPLTLGSSFIMDLSKMSSQQMEIEFDNYLRTMLTTDVYYADATIYKNSNEAEPEKLIAIYSIVDDCDSVVPTFNRYPDAKALVSGSIYPNQQLLNGDSLGLINYDQFLAAVDKFKVRDFDTKHIVINLKEKDMRAIWEQNKVDKA